MTRALFKRLSIYVGLSLFSLIAIGGFLHTKAGRPLLARLGVGCPARASAADIEAARRNSARLQRGAEAASARPALGFVLDGMRHSDIVAWAERQHVACEDVRTGLMRCTDVPAAALGAQGPPVSRLDLGFSLAEERLVNVSAWREQLSAEVAATRMNQVVADLQERVGSPTRQAGTRSAEYLASGPLRTAVVVYRYSDYIADVSATHIAGRGLSLREHYMSARD